MEQLEEMDGIPAGKQCYVVTQEDHDGERTICTTLVVMTEVFCKPDDLGKHINLDKPARSDVSRFFADMSVKIARAMDGGRKDA